MSRNIQEINVNLKAEDPSGSPADLQVDNSGNLKVDGTVSVSNFPSVYPAAAGTSYTLGYTGSQLTTITRASDGKHITFGYTGNNLTSISDWDA